MKKRYVIVGCGHRCYTMFAKNLVENDALNAEICGIYDINKGRSEFYKRDLDKDNKIKIFEDFDLMIDEIKPDAVIVATMDNVHDFYIIKSLKKGCNVITEKPMATDENKIKNILQAEKESGKKVIVTFNCRFMPFMVKIKELVSKNAIGKILNVNYEYLLGRTHGADYFRRWHRKMEYSNSLLVHKATHHLDIVNWLLMDEPESVVAKGDLLYFGKNGKFRGERCTDCKHSKECLYYDKFENNEFYKNLYFDNEKNDGYYRDQCVYDNEIDIYDTMSLITKYTSGTILSYNLTMYNPYEGFKITLTGENGRIEACDFYEGIDAYNNNYEIKQFNESNECIIHQFSKASGTHGGGDARLLEMIFKGNIEDKLNQCASSYDGAKSALIGICANKSIKEKKEINIKQYLDELKTIIKD